MFDGYRNTSGFRFVGNSPQIYTKCLTTATIYARKMLHSLERNMKENMKESRTYYQNKVPLQSLRTLDL